MARDIAKTDAYQTSRYQRKKVEMLFAHLKRILNLDRLRLRGPVVPAPSPRTSGNWPRSALWGHPSKPLRARASRRP